MRRNGFSLLELLVTLVIVAILAAIAWPGYAAVMQRVQRNDARLALLTIAHAEELHYQGFNAYGDALTQAVAQGGLGLTAQSAAGSYQLAVELRATDQGYLASARPTLPGRQAADRTCAQLTIDEIGTRGAKDSAGRDTTALCWR